MTRISRTASPNQNQAAHTQQRKPAAVELARRLALTAQVNKSEVFRTVLELKPQVSLSSEKVSVLCGRSPVCRHESLTLRLPLLTSSAPYVLTPHPFHHTTCLAFNPIAQHHSSLEHKMDSLIPIVPFQHLACRRARHTAKFFIYGGWEATIALFSRTATFVFLSFSEFPLHVTSLPLILRYSRQLLRRLDPQGSTPA